MSFEPSASVVEDVGVLFPRPKPVKGCDICAALYVQMLKHLNPASAEYSPDRSREVEIEIRNHPHGVAE